jgi:hypothetical protein
MATSSLVIVTGAVEGPIDEAVLQRLVEYVGGTPGPVHGRNGKSHLRQRLDGYNQAARLSPWAVLVDLNHDGLCAPPFRALWLPNPSPYMCFWVAVRMVESWLLADRERLARFLSVTAAQVPSNPEGLDNPKHVVVNLARLSRRREIREDMVPRPGSGRAVGPAYTSRLIEFVVNSGSGWRPDVAARSSDSLDRCLRCLRWLVKGAK